MLKREGLNGGSKLGRIFTTDMKICNEFLNGTRLRIGLHLQKYK